MTTTSSTSSSSASSGVLSSLGVGSGLDISSLVSQLTTAEMSAANSRVTREQTAVTTQVSALASLKSAISTFQATLDALTTASSGFDARSVATTDSTVVTGTATSKAAVGSYDVKVNQLAKAQQLVSNVFSGGASGVVGTGTLSLSLGSSSFNVTIDSSNNTLTGIRDAINSASGNPGISATLVYGTSGAQLLLTSSQTGASNTISIDETDSGSGLSALVYKTGNTSNYTVKQAAQDSSIEIAGVTHTASSNTVTDAIDGMTLNLKAAQLSTDSAETLTISDDTSHVTSLVQSFVSAYNTMASALSSLGSYDSSTKTAGAMFGDSLLAAIQNQISTTLSSAVTSGSSAYTTLASMGITKALDGTLSVDSTKLSSALSSNFSSVVNTLGGTNGVVTKLNTLLQKQLASGNGIDTRSTSLSEQQTQIDDENTAIQLRTQQVQQRYLAKFNAMDSLLATLQSTSTYLTQQFNALNKSGS
jgi:flagellar hook-associated protein 2